ncbi:hypothetical protein LRAMOSA09117 [Lichtheimia ramosa]|uniref:glucan endo-1,3-beta-D-glucosidase n=1 Tax=Lichtheimia ramosa TaxID=688394 RepID=A0A077WHF5_9FUNG|nr:hypothetical protein LRAMOSA09117 [Lichtheimia ramosa]
MSSSTAELALQATQSLGMRLYLGIWIDEHPDTFDREFASLQRAIQNHKPDNVDGVIVGSEVLYREDQSLGYLIDRIHLVRNALQGYNIPVTSADTFNKITPELANEIDFVMINVFPYWEGVSIDNAANTVMDHYNEAVSHANGKPVRISETGWPTAGANYKESVPSPENQQRYMREILCRTKQAGIDMIWFSAIDEPYKNDVEGHFGFLHAQDRALKPALRVQWDGAC